MRRVENLPRIVQLSVGSEHNVALAGKLFNAIRANTFLQLIASESTGETTKYVELNVAETGTIFCWGWNEHGNCGNGNMKDVLLPERLPLPHNSVGVLVGSGAGHSFAVIKDVN